MKKYIFIILLIPLIFSCEKRANIDIPNSKPELVTACFAGANEDTIRLKLAWSSPIYYTSKTNLESESSATVILSKGNQHYNMKWDSIGSQYIATNTFFKENDVLKLDISYQTHKVKASCTIPSKPQYEMKYKGVEDVSNSDYISHMLVYNFTNKSTASNSYYRILFLGYYFDKSSQKVYSSNLYNSESDLLSLVAGESKEIKVYYDSYGSYYRLDSVKYYIIHCSNDYYKYHKSVYNYSGDDFFVEPSIIYNNVEGGLGIFSSYYLVTDTNIINY